MSGLLLGSEISDGTPMLKCAVDNVFIFLILTVQLGTVDGDELLEHLFGEVVRGVEVDGPQLLQVAVLHPVL